MAINNSGITPEDNKSVLDLPIIEDPQGMWILASIQGDTPGSTYSGRYSLTDYLSEASSKLQLERRLSITMEANTFDLFIDEQMTIYRIAAQNVGTLKIDGQTAAIGNVNIGITQSKVVRLDITKTSTDAKSFIFIYAKAIVP